jgi:hypothetical protein
MAYQEKTTTGYGTRVGNSLKSVLMGFVMIIGATILLFWNEFNYVKQDNKLDAVQEACVDMPNPEKKSAEFEGEVVCATAMATTEEVLTDQEFGISENAIGLIRKVEYYQYVEHSESKSEDKLGGKEETTTTYTYKPEWVSSPVNSADFKDPAYQNKNFTLAQVEEQKVYAKNVSFGAYVLSESLISSISSKEAVELNVNPQTLQSINTSVANTFFAVRGVSAGAAAPAPQPAVADSTAAAADSVATNNKVDLEYVHQAGNTLYYGRTANAPEIGDVRITFEKVVPAKVTIIAQVDGNTFKSYKTKYGSYQTLRMGKMTSEEIFQDDHESNSMWTWILRIVGTLLVISGIKSLFSFVETLLKVVPFLSSLFAFGVGIISTIIGLVYSLIVIAIAWVLARPLVGIIILVVAGLLIWVFAFNGKKKLAELANKGKAAPAAE